mmetsp:Transcript_29436/g.71629  ORF Transcript_29436/g.71629 Transcript_29436/m.71629 type:complete len:276 (+) Transcript_29436:414-1241(+)
MCWRVPRVLCERGTKSRKRRMALRRWRRWHQNVRAAMFGTASGRQVRVAEFLCTECARQLAECICLIEQVADRRSGKHVGPSRQCRSPWPGGNKGYLLNEALQASDHLGVAVNMQLRFKLPNDGDPTDDGLAEQTLGWIGTSHAVQPALLKRLAYTLLFLVAVHFGDYVEINYFGQTAKRFRNLWSKADNLASILLFPGEERTIVHFTSNSNFAHAGQRRRPPCASRRRHQLPRHGHPTGRRDQRSCVVHTLAAIASLSFALRGGLGRPSPPGDD